MSVLAPERLVERAEDEARAAQAGPRVGSLIRWVTAGCSFGAAILHFANAPSHFSQYWLYGLFFVVVAWLQLLFAVGVSVRPGRWVLLAGTELNLAAVAVWAFSRTVAVVVGP